MNVRQAGEQKHEDSDEAHDKKRMTLVHENPPGTRRPRSFVVLPNENSWRFASDRGQFDE